MTLAAKNMPWFANIHKSGTYRFTDASTAGAMGVITNFQTIYTAGDLGAIVSGVSINSSDSAARVMLFAIKNGSTCIPLFMIPVPALSGTSSTVTAVDALSSTWASSMPIDGNGKRYIPLAEGEELVCAPDTTLTAAKFINVTALGADYES